MPSPVVVIGAGPSGLATAYYLQNLLGHEGSVTVLERAPQIGGKVRTVDVTGLAVDTGPDAFLARAPELRALIESLGLGADVEEPLGGGAYVWSRGRLRPLPPGAAFGLPERLWPLLRSGLLSPAGVARAGLDLILPRQQVGADPTVADLVRPRFGGEVYSRLVEPLLGGVHAGSPAVLSANSTVPEIAGMARSGRSLYLTMRSRRRAAPPPTTRSAPLVGLRGGMGTLTSALAGALTPGTIRCGVRVRSIEDGVVRTDVGDFPAGHVVLAVPAYSAADLVQPLSAPAAGRLRAIPYVDVANATLAFDRNDVPPLPAGTGFLVPPAEGEFIVGCTWLTSKWPHLADTDTVLIKAMVGRYGDDRWVGMSDAQLLDGVRDGLRRMLGITADPTQTFVQRWPKAMPQYVVGHAARLAQLDADLETIEGVRVTVTGAAYRGVGLAGCIAQARATATRIAEEAPV